MIGKDTSRNRQGPRRHGQRRQWRPVSGGQWSMQSLSPREWTDQMQVRGGRPSGDALASLGPHVLSSLRVTNGKLAGFQRRLRAKPVPERSEGEPEWKPARAKRGTHFFSGSSSFSASAASIRRLEDRRRDSWPSGGPSGWIHVRVELTVLIGCDSGVCPEET